MTSGFPAVPIRQGITAYCVSPFDLSFGMFFLRYSCFAHGVQPFSLGFRQRRVRLAYDFEQNVWRPQL